MYNNRMLRGPSIARKHCLLLISGNRDVQAVSAVQLQQQPSTAVQGACWNISPCLLHCYLYNCCASLYPLSFDPAAMKWCQRGAQLILLLKNLLSSFVSPVTAFPAKRSLHEMMQIKLLSHLLTGLLVVVLTQHTHWLCWQPLTKGINPTAIRELTF